jgi:serine/threonine protein kinase
MQKLSYLLLQNQLKLAIKISTCDVNEIDIEEFSLELRQLVKSILSKDPDERPSAREILDHPVFSSRSE